MRRWRTYIAMLLVVLVLVNVPVYAGGNIDFGAGFQALFPFVLLNAVVTAFFSSIFIGGCPAPPT